MSEEKTTGQMPFLSVRDLVVEYTMEGKVVHAVNGVSFDIQRGKTLALVGETGAGKTSIAKAILRVLPDPPAKITNGEIFVEGQDILKLKENEMRKYRGNKISMIFQDPMTALNPVKRVVDQIVEGIRQHEKKLSHAEAYNRACDMLNMVGISDDRAGEYPHQFSGGMKQRVVIALALACSPELLLADEPTTGAGRYNPGAGAGYDQGPAGQVQHSHDHDQPRPWSSGGSERRRGGNLCRRGS